MLLFGWKVKSTSPVPRYRTPIIRQDSSGGSHLSHKCYTGQTTMNRSRNREDDDFNRGDESVERSPTVKNKHQVSQLSSCTTPARHSPATEYVPAPPHIGSNPSFTCLPSHPHLPVPLLTPFHPHKLTRRLHHHTAQTCAFTCQ